MLTIGSLFAGIGGLELGLEWAGLGPVLWQVELDADARKVLAEHWPIAERYTDVRIVRGEYLAPVDLICGGFPCQDLSAAGKRTGLRGARSGLWTEFRRVVSEVRPRWVVVENVAGGADYWVDAVCRSLAELAYAPLPIPLSATNVGSPQRRSRIFIVAARCDGSLRQHAQPVHASMEGARSAAAPRRATSWQTPLATVLRMGDGVSDRMGSGITRKRRVALGNAVVPQCAEVIGHVIRELMR